MGELEELLGQVKKRYEVYFEPVKIGENELFFLQIANMVEQIEKIVAAGKDISYLYWAKIWEGSVLLAYMLAQQPVKPIAAPKTCLEIGAGIGVAGLFAAAFGYKVTLNDINEDALLFARINALKNDLDVEIKQVDFTQDRLNTQYDLILASEVAYDEGVCAPLLAFFKHHLSPNGVIYMTQKPKMNPKLFQEMAQKDFWLQTKILRLREDKETHTLYFYTLKRRS